MKIHMKLMLKKWMFLTRKKRNLRRRARSIILQSFTQFRWLREKVWKGEINADLHETHTEEVDIPNMQKRNLRRSERSIILNVFTEFIWLEEKVWKGEINKDPHETHAEEVNVPNTKKRNLRRHTRSIILLSFQKQPNAQIIEW